jgi:hypothetical protein
MVPRTLLALGALTVSVAAWRLSHRPPVVVLGATAHVARIQSALRDIDGAVRGRLDTVDLSQPHRLRIVVRAPAGRRLGGDAAYARDRVDEILMEAHARLAWSRLTAFRTLYARDTVFVALRRDFLSPIGLPSSGRQIRSQVFRSPWQLGWSGHWRSSDVSVR